MAASNFESLSPSQAPLNGWHFRAATAADAWPIRWLVLRAGLDPTQLRWQQFWVVEAASQLVACGQLRQLSAARELGSMVVQRRWRQRGIGTALAQLLIQQHLQLPEDCPLYLECLGQVRRRFYARLGFETVAVSSSQSLPQKFAITQKLAAGLGLPLFVMEWHAPFPTIDSGGQP